MLWCGLGWSQEKKTTITFAVGTDTLHLSTSPINPNTFSVKNRNGINIDSSLYRVNYTKAFVVLNSLLIKEDSLQISFKNLPKFITKTYQIYDDSKLVKTEIGKQFLLKDPVKTKTAPLFDGLQSAGTIARGITVGNNQDATVNSNLDLQISGKLSNKVSIRASLQDSNIPIQNDGYSQTLDEFDQIFVELFAENWNIRAGDLFLENRIQRFLNFNKKVQGISSNIILGKQQSTTLTNGASLVRGQYAKSTFVGNEGNQGPYKLKGPNNELFVLIISGSERVFVNGNILTRGENKDYIIDYNAGEIIFTSLFPITSEMRINVEYQYTDRNFTRFLTYNGFTTKKENWEVGSYIYTENDVKNQPLQQNLSTEQVEVLQQAGDNPNLMFSDSGVIAENTEDQITYKKTPLGTGFYYEFNTDNSETLYKVRFRYVGESSGDYELINNQTLEKIYAYTPPIDGIKQGNYEPTVALIPPTKKQITTVFGNFNPNSKTKIEAEIATSNQDNNLYSNLNDNDNIGWASWVNGSHEVEIKNTKHRIKGNWQFLNKNFNPIERINTIEFNRDWNLPVTNFTSNQNQLSFFVDSDLSKNSKTSFGIEHLSLGEFSGKRYLANYNINKKSISFRGNSNYVETNSDTNESSFLRSNNEFVKKWKSKWIGTALNLENNKETDKSTGSLTNLSQRFIENHVFGGIGDSTNVYTQIGYKRRVNDSIQLNSLNRVNSSNSYYLNSQLIKNERRSLSVFANYRTLIFTETKKKIPTLNSRVNYQDSYFKNGIILNSQYETQSGTVAQQEFTYIEVNPGQGVYMWIDYNENGIQELQEFEVAPYPDLALYVRVFLPNQNFIKTHSVRFSQSVNINFSKLNFNTKWLSKFNNLTTYLIEKKDRQINNQLAFNPFKEIDNLTVVGLNYNFRNTLFFNRGKKKHFTTYTYQESENRNNLATGMLINQLKSHQLQYQHWFKTDLQFTLSGVFTKNKVEAEGFTSRNYNINASTVKPKLTYIFEQNISASLLGDWNTKNNTIGDFETLEQFKFGIDGFISSSKGFSFSGAFLFIKNKFEGNANNAVGFSMLEGLQIGNNTTWNTNIQKSLSKYLDLTLNYQGRKGEKGKTIHNGTVQLRMNF